MRKQLKIQMQKCELIKKYYIRINVESEVEAIKRDKKYIEENLNY